MYLTIPLRPRAVFNVCLAVSAMTCAPASTSLAQDKLNSSSALTATADAAPLAPVPDSSGINLDRIMSDPEWLGRAPEGGYWADDGESIYYRRQQAGSSQYDWFQADLQGNILRVVEPQERGAIDHDGGVISRDQKWKAYERAGDLFIKNLESGAIRQLTRTTDRESAPSFMADGKRLMFRRGDTILARHLKSGLEQQLVDLRATKKPEDTDSNDEEFLPEQQQRLFEYLRKQRSEQELARETRQTEQAADPTRVPLPWYLGDTHRPDNVQVSPNGRWCIVSLSSKQSASGAADKMPEFVQADGYVNSRDVRPLVGTGKRQSDKLLLLDLKNHSEHELSFADLPDFDNDPLAEVRAAGEAWRKERSAAKQAEAKSVDANTDASRQPADDKTVAAASENGQAAQAKASDKPESDKPESDKPDEAKRKKQARAVLVSSLKWNATGDQVAVQLYSADNKDRWLNVVDLKAKKLKNIMHRRDPAWIDRGIGQLDWLADHQTLLYRTEATGYAQLYATHVPSMSTRQLTQGEFVVSDVQPSRDGKSVYYNANADHPGIYEAYRVDVASGTITQLTQLGGINDFVVSPDQRHLLVTHSTALSPPELWIQPLDAAEPARQITRTVSAEFSELPWIEPQFVTVPSRAGRPIHARLYLPPGYDPAAVLAGDTNDKLAQPPAVLFIHGAGYLQNAHQGWSGYFREFMFHSLLAHRGFVVLDMDYRASAGYGRDWRTAIYRHMGRPEVDDLLDGRSWLGEQYGVDIERVGLYGGSYGGFLTMMALFQEPGTFACGAALRPVTDWAHYNHGYTSNILNTPDIDPEAYFRSSPIELAEGLADPLLICHGMVDDNVFFKDTARLAQRLIELKKKDWEVAIYPIEPHGFEQPSSWYDEYRRILELFEKQLAR
jgi:dipeptidyl aminopeptidase/acylaminoacyl peptidase